jgi:pre-mRNA-processing factor SLU7
LYRWNGYNPDEHQTIIDEYNKVELAKRQLKAEKLQEELISGQLSEETVNKVILYY